jgi:hypothetical protein
VGLLGQRDQPRRALGRLREERLVRPVEDAVATLQLRPVDGEVGLVDELVRVGAVAREAGDAERDRGVDRLARGLDLEVPGRDRAADPLRDLDRLLRRRLRKQDAELLAAEARRHVVVAQLLAEDLGDALQDGVAGEVAVGVVDVAEQVEVGHDHRHRPVEARRPRELVGEDVREVARVEEARLRVDARLRLQLRHRQRAVDQQQRRDREGDEVRVPDPEGRDPQAEGREHEVGGDALEREDAVAELAEREAAGEPQHRRQHEVVERDVEGAGGEAGDGEADVAVRDERRRVQDRVRDRPGDDVGDREDADVEGLDVPGEAVLQPLGDVLDDRHQHQQLRRQQQDRRDHEDAVRVVALVALRVADVEELRDRRAGGEQGEVDPAPRLRVDVHHERHRDPDRDGGYGGPVRDARERHPRPRVDRAGVVVHRVELAGQRAHRPAHRRIELVLTCVRISFRVAAVRSPEAGSRPHVRQNRDRKVRPAG